MTSKNELRREKAKLAKDTLSDSYIISLLISKSRILKASHIKAYPDLIECKRIQLKIKRLIKFQKDEKN